MACFGINVQIDGALDTCRYLFPHIFQFGLTANQQAIFFDQGTLGYDIGRCDDLKIFGGLTICGQAVSQRAGVYTGSLSGNAFGEWVGHNFDTFATVDVEAGEARFSACHFSLGSIATAGGTKTARFGLRRGGSANVSIASSRFLTGVAPTDGYVLGDYATAGGALDVIGGRMELGAVDTIGIAINGSAAQATLLGMHFLRVATASPASQMVAINSGRGAALGLVFSPPSGSGGGAALGVNAALPWTVAACNFGGRSAGYTGSPTVWTGNAA